MYQHPFSFNFIRKGACSQFIYSCVCHGSVLVAEELIVHHFDGAVCIVLVHQYRNTNLGCSNHLDIDTCIIQRLEHIGGHAHMRHHTGAHQADLGHIIVHLNAVIFEHILVLFQHPAGIVQAAQRAGKARL